MKGVLISDFSINNLSGYLTNDTAEPKVTCVIAPFNQVHQVLMDKNMECWKGADFVVVWTQPEKALKQFDLFLNNEKINISDLLKEVETFADLIISASASVKIMFVTTWTVDTVLNYSGLSDTQPNIGAGNVLAQMNKILADKLWSTPNVYLLDSARWIDNHSYNPKLWYLTKTPFNNDVFSKAAQSTKSALRTILGTTKKLIVVDLDNTLWGGVVGDVGYENLKLGGHDAEGEAYKDFQLSLKAFVNKGILLAVASKNEETVAMEAIDKHPEMILSKKDFSSLKINWNDKVKNIVEISEELNLGLDSIVFIDDNPHERARVREALPQIFVPELPEDPLLYKQFLLGLNCFNSFMISDEDRKRTKLYAEEKGRVENKKEFQDIEEWLASINIQVTIEKVNKGNCQRVLQLLNKTNQMNLQTNRYTQQELEEFVRVDNRDVFTFSVSDKFGDAGLVGIASVIYESPKAVLNDFVISCRVMGRKLEEIMLHTCIEAAKNKSCKMLSAQYIPTEKNKPCFDFFKYSGFKLSETIFEWDLKNTYVIPAYVIRKVVEF